MVLDQRTKSQEEEEAEARAKAAEMAQGLRQQKIGALLGQVWRALEGSAGGRQFVREASARQ